MMDPATGQLIFCTNGSGNICHNIDAEIVDENENGLGDFSKFCEQAIDAWEQALIQTGVQIPISD
jgi:hypothetical protein